MRATAATISAAVLAAAMVWLPGCAAAPVVIGADAKLPEDDGSPAFIDRISSETLVSEDNAMRGVLMLLDEQDAAKNFRERVDKLLARKVIDRTWSYDAARPITRGKVAYMIYQACGISGGVVLQLTGPSQRYCLRELQYLGIMPAGSILSKVSGMEFQAVLARADALLQTGEVPEVLKLTESY